MAGNNFGQRVHKSVQNYDIFSNYTRGKNVLVLNIMSWPSTLFLSNATNY